MTIIELPTLRAGTEVPDRERDLCRQIDILEAKIRVLQFQRDELVQRVLAIRAGRA